MELTSEFEVDVPVDDAWAVLTDLQRLTPCVPGARLDHLEGDQLRGTLEVKVGPIDAEYEARSAFVEVDDEKHRILMSVTGHDTHGQGDATASITLDLEPLDGGTQVNVLADLAVSGKVAQFGRGALADVGADLMKQFVGNLEAEVNHRRGVPPAASSASRSSSATSKSSANGSVLAVEAAVKGASEPGVRASRPASMSSDGSSESSEPEPEAGPAVRVLAAVGAVVAVVAFGYLLRRRSVRRSR